jgi:prepilin-type N-terminal cleavage/methylation domain-containing protein
MHRVAPTRKSDERGLTMIELMVTVMIIGILIAIGLPAMLGARLRAQNRAAQVRVRNAFTAAKTEFANDGSYANVTPATLTAGEPSLSYNTSTPASMADVSIRDVTDPLSCW